MSAWNASNLSFLGQSDWWQCRKSVSLISIIYTYQHRRNKLQSYLDNSRTRLPLRINLGFLLLKPLQHIPLPFYCAAATMLFLWAYGDENRGLNSAGEVGLWPFHGCTTTLLIHFHFYAWLHGRPLWPVAWLCHEDGRIIVAYAWFFHHFIRQWP